MGVPLVSPKMRASCAPRKAPLRRPERLASSGRFAWVLLLAPLLLLPTSSGSVCALAGEGDWSGPGERGGRPAGSCWEPWWLGPQVRGRVPRDRQGLGWKVYPGVGGVGTTETTFLGGVAGGFTWGRVAPPPPPHPHSAKLPEWFWD